MTRTQLCTKWRSFVYSTKFLHQLSDQQLHSISPLAQHYVLPTELCPVIFATPYHPLSLSSSFCCHYLNEMLLATTLQLPPHPPTTQVVSKCHHCAVLCRVLAATVALLLLTEGEGTGNWKKEWQNGVHATLPLCIWARSFRKFYSRLTH